MVTHLIENDCVSELRAVDKTPPQMAWLNHQHMTAFNNAKVEFCSANLINTGRSSILSRHLFHVSLTISRLFGLASSAALPHMSHSYDFFSLNSCVASCKNAFASSTTDDQSNWDYVFNCAAETRLGQTDAVYGDGILKLSTNCMNESISHGTRRYIEFSSGNMLSSDQWPIKEDCVIKPWTQIAQQKAKVEQELTKRHNELNYTILRLPLVYGKGDRKGLSE